MYHDSFGSCKVSRAVTGMLTSIPPHRGFMARPGVEEREAAPLAQQPFLGPGPGFARGIQEGWSQSCQLTLFWLFGGLGGTRNW